MTIFQGALLGLLQGIGEFLPVSSSGHMLLARILMGIQEDTPEMKMLDVLMHLGTLIPLLIVFRKEWIHMIRHPWKDPTLRLLVLSAVPTVIFYLLAKLVFLKPYDGYAIFDSGWFLGPAYLMTAVLLILADKLGKNSKKTEVGYKQMTAMGIIQGGIAVIPGVSRSGSTIFAGVASGLNRETAARFSFMMSAPVIAGGLLLELKNVVEENYVTRIAVGPTVVGIIVAAIVGFLTIRFFLKIIKKSTLLWFALYCAILGVFVLIMQLSGNPNFPPFQLPAVG